MIRKLLHYFPPNVELPARTLKARVVLDNRQNLLRVGQAARVRIQVDRPRPAILIPKHAIVDDHVFVRTPKGYEKRTVRTGQPQDTDLEVTNVKPGEEVVTEGVDLL